MIKKKRRKSKPEKELLKMENVITETKKLKVWQISFKIPQEVSKMKKMENIFKRCTCSIRRPNTQIIRLPRKEMQQDDQQNNSRKFPRTRGQELILKELIKYPEEWIKIDTVPDSA